MEAGITGSENKGCQSERGPRATPHGLVPGHSGLRSLPVAVYARGERIYSEICHAGCHSNHRVIGSVSDHHPGTTIGVVIPDEADLLRPVIGDTRRDDV
ncbi:hypothetical protein HAV15_012415 [Penicillium sp. str. |nr:hypothetical protein HAV15_012415 [Penicillium sp. str. \